MKEIKIWCFIWDEGKVNKLEKAWFNFQNPKSESYYIEMEANQRRKKTKKSIRKR